MPAYKVIYHTADGKEYDREVEEGAFPTVQDTVARIREELSHGEYIEYTYKSGVILLPIAQVTGIEIALPPPHMQVSPPETRRR